MWDDKTIEKKMAILKETGMSYSEFRMLIAELDLAVKSEARI